MSLKYSWNERRPDIHKSTLAWEASWQEDFDQNFHALAHFPPGVFAIPSSVTQRSSDEALLYLQRESRGVCSLQFDLASAVARRSLEENFDEKWKALSAGQRQDFILQGLVRTMTLPDMASRREWCPESTLRSLNAQGGEGYLRLLSQLKPENLDAPAVEPILIPHEVADRVMMPSAKKLQEPGIKTVLRSYKVSRSYCLSSLVWNIFLAYLGLEEKQYVARPPGLKRDAPVAKEHRAFFEETARMHNAFRRNLRYACANCEMTADTLPPGTVFQACSKCRAIGRKVLYCSRECQVNDWKNGRPRPHKQICGKPLTEDDFQTAATTDTGTSNLAPWLPPADPTFKRSPALLLQLRRLTEKRDVDYVIASPYNSGDPDYGIHIPDSEYTERVLFLIHRNRALRTGDVSSVNVMYYSLCRLRMTRDSPKLCDALRKQLMAEFGVDVYVTGEDVDLLDPTEDELEFVMAWLLQGE